MSKWVNWKIYVSVIHWLIHNDLHYLPCSNLKLQLKTSPRHNTPTKNAAHLPEFPDAADRAPIKLDAAADPVDAGAEHHGGAPGEVQVVRGGVVRQVQVIGERRVFGCYRVDLLHERRDRHRMPGASHGHLGAGKNSQFKTVSNLVRNI